LDSSETNNPRICRIAFFRTIWTRYDKKNLT
jgi:hypothetical protein